MRPYNLDEFVPSFDTRRREQERFRRKRKLLLGADPEFPTSSTASETGSDDHSEESA